MTEQQKTWLEALSHCTFLPGSYDKRFVNNLHAQAVTDPEKPLSEKQAKCLEEKVHRYRRQLARK